MQHLLQKKAPNKIQEVLMNAVGKRNVFLPVLLFSLYIFVFLLTELTVNDRCTEVLGESFVTVIYSAGILCTSIGYVGFYVSRILVRTEEKRKLLIVVIAMTYMISAFCFICLSYMTVFVISAMLALLLFGYIGGFTHYLMSLLLFKHPHSGLIIGSAIALATTLQFIVQNLLISHIVFLSSLVLSVIVITYISLRPVKDRISESFISYPTKPLLNRKKLVLPICIVALMSIISGLGDGIVTQLDAGGTINLTSYSRFFYALGILIAGFIADIHNRRLLPLFTLCMLILSTAMMLFIGESNTVGNNIYVSVLYLFCGFYVMYLTVVFLDTAVYTSAPDLWAGMGRIVRGIFIGSTVLVSNRLFESAGQQGTVIIGIILSLVALILFVLSGSLNIKQEIKDQPANRKVQFLSSYKFTPREAEILGKLVEEDCTNRDIAEELFISVRVLERYISSIYEKTGVRNRVGLVKLYYNDLNH